MFLANNFPVKTKESFLFTRTVKATLKDQGSVDTKDFSDSGDSEFDNHGNSTFLVCLHGLTTVYIPMFSDSKFLHSQKRCLQFCSVTVLKCGI